MTVKSLHTPSRWRLFRRKPGARAHRCDWARVERSLALGENDGQVSALVGAARRASLWDRGVHQ